MSIQYGTAKSMKFYIFNEFSSVKGMKDVL